MTIDTHFRGPEERESPYLEALTHLVSVGRESIVSDRCRKPGTTEAYVQARKRVRFLWDDLRVEALPHPLYFPPEYLEKLNQKMAYMIAAPMDFKSQECQDILSAARAFEERLKVAKIQENSLQRTSLPRNDEVQPASGETDSMGGETGQLGPNQVHATNDGPSSGSPVKWRDVQKALVRIRADRERFTSVRALARRMKCSRGTIQKAINKSSGLKAWVANDKADKAPRMTGLNNIVLDNVEQSKEPDPAKCVSDDELAELIAESKRDYEPSPIDDHPRRSARQYKQACARLHPVT